MSAASGNWYLVWLACLFISGCCVILVASKHRNWWIHPYGFYALFHFWIFVTRPFFVETFNYTEMYIYMGTSPEKKIMSLLLPNISFMIFSLITFMNPKSDTNRIRFYRSQNHSTWAQEKVILISMIIILIPAVASLIYTMVNIRTVGFSSLSGSGINLVIDRETGRILYQNSTGYFTLAQSIIPYIAILLFVSTRFRVFASTLFISYIFVKIFSDNARYQIIYPLMSVFIMWVTQAKIRYILPKLLSAGAVGMALFAYGGAYRYHVRRGGSISDISLEDLFARGPFSSGPDFANYEYLNYILVHVPDTSGGYANFAPYLELFVRPIPRMLWPGKPIGSPVESFNLNDFGNFLGLTPSAVGDAWLNGGVLGIITVFILVGMVSNYSFSRFLRASEDSFIRVGYIFLLPLVLQWARDGGIGIVMLASFALLPVLIAGSVKHLIRRELVQTRTRSPIGNNKP